MNAFFAYLQKEFQELLRAMRLLIFAVVFFSFALLDVAMVRLMPFVLQQAGQDPEALGFITSTDTAFASFAGDAFEIGCIVVGLCCMGLLTSERSRRTILIPRMTGARAGALVGAKFLVNSAALVAVSVFSFLLCFCFARLLIGGDSTLGFAGALAGGAGIGVFFAFLVSLSLFFGSFFKKSVFTGLSVIAAGYLTALPGALLPDARAWFPYYIMQAAGTGDYTGMLKAICVTAALTALFCLLAARLFDRREL